MRDWFFIGLLSLSIQAQATTLHLSLTEHPTQYVAAKVLSEVFKESGLGLEVKTFPAVRATALGRSREYDGEVARIEQYYDDKPYLKMIVPSYYGFGTAVFAKKKLGAKLTSSEELKNYRVGAVRGIMHSEMAIKNVKQKFFMNDVEQLYQALHTGRIEFAVDTEFSGNYFIKKLGYQDIEYVGQVAYHELFSGISVKWEDVNNKISHKIKELKKSGKLRTIIEKAEKEVLTAELK